jgi:hypothetical protein
MPMHYHPKSGQSKPASGKTPAGWMLAEELVDVRNGHTVWISCEPSVNSGQGVAQALSLRREDPGHENEPAFMTREMYARLPEGERKKMLAEPVSPPKATHEKKAKELEERNAALQAELAALKKQAEGRR